MWISRVSKVLWRSLCNMLIKILIRRAPPGRWHVKGCGVVGFEDGAIKTCKLIYG